MVTRMIVTKALRVKGEGECCRKDEDDDEDDVENEAKAWWQGRAVGMWW